jgi:hypothetical protein
LRPSGLARKLRNRFLAISAQLRLIALETLLQCLASLTGAQVLGVVFAQLRDSPVFTTLLSLSLSVSACHASSD